MGLIIMAFRVLKVRRYKSKQVVLTPSLMQILEIYNSQELASLPFNYTNPLECLAYLRRTYPPYDPLNSTKDNPILLVYKIQEWGGRRSKSGENPLKVWFPVNPISKSPLKIVPYGDIRKGGFYEKLCYQLSKNGSMR